MAGLRNLMIRGCRRRLGDHKASGKLEEEWSKFYKWEDTHSFVRYRELSKINGETLVFSALSAEYDDYGLPPLTYAAVQGLLDLSFYL